MVQTQPETSGEAKKRRACDECRTRKLACSKEQDGCRRCKREGIACIYSAQKPMGRPRKRPREVEQSEEAPEQSGLPALPASTDASAGLSQPVADGDVGLSILADQATSPGLNLFDFIGISDMELDPLPQFQTSLPTPPAVPSAPPPAPIQGPDIHSPSMPHYKKAFPKSLFGMDFGMDFSGDTVDMTSGTAFPAAALASPSASDAATASPPPLVLTTSGATPAPADTISTAATTAAPIPATLGEGSSSTTGIAQNTPQTWTMASAAAAIASAGGSGGGNTGSNIVTAPDVAMTDVYSKASAAWLLTAPNRVCGCLARLYLALDSLQHLPDQVGPAMAVARNAAHAAHDTVLCPSCSPPNLADSDYRPPLQAYQNLMILGALLPSIAHTYRRIVAMVDAEAARAAAANERLTISLSAYGGVWGHLADWDNFCAQKSAMENSLVQPPLWRLVVRALLKMDVYGIHLDRSEAGEDAAGPAATAVEGHSGNGAAAVGSPNKASAIDSATAAALGSDSNNPAPAGMIVAHYGLKDIADMMLKRAVLRHEAMDAAIASGAVKPGDVCGYVPLPPGEKPNCQRIIEQAKREIDMLVIV